MSEILILLGVGLLAGVFSGVLGLGGGIIVVPALVYFLKMNQHLAQGTTLALLLPPITLLSTYVYWKQGYVDIRVTIFLCIGFFLGGYFGGKIAVMLPSLMLKKGFAIFLMCVAIHMFLSKK
jgi:uncharacterized membrane protein YfcA